MTFCAGRRLSSLIPDVILSAPRASSVFVISPWIENVPLRIPAIMTQKRHVTTGQMLLSDLLVFAVSERKIQFVFVTRPGSTFISQAVANLGKIGPNLVQVYGVATLHAKALVTDCVYVQTSGNLIWTSLYRNVEACSLWRNKYGNARQFVRQELALRV